MIQFNYHHLYYFYTIAQNQSMSAAANQLLLNQSTLSIQLRQFERSLGKSLFKRQRQRLILTSEGRRVLDYARKIFEIGRQMEEELKEDAVASRRTISVGILNGTPRAFGHALLRALRSYDPKALIALREGDMSALLRELREFRLDAIMTDISLRGQDREDLENHLLAKFPIVFAAAPGIAGKYRRLPQDFDEAPFILPSLPSPVYSQILDLLSEWRIRPRIIAEVQDVELARRMALSGEGIAPLNAYTVAKSLPRGGLTVVGNRDWGLRESVHMVTRRARDMEPLVAKIKIEISNSST